MLLSSRLKKSSGYFWYLFRVVKLEKCFLSRWITRTCARYRLQTNTPLKKTGRGRYRKRTKSKLRVREECWGRKWDKRQWEKGREGEREKERGRKRALYAFLSARRFVCNNLCEKTAWEMTASSLCNSLICNSLLQDRFEKWPAARYEGTAQKYVCSSHERHLSALQWWSIKKISSLKIDSSCSDYYWCK